MNDIKRRYQVAGIALLFCGLACWLGAQSTRQDVASGEPLWVDPRAYGANGQDKSDDTDALLAAISAAKASGRTLQLPPGRFYIARPLVLDAAMTIRGSGATSTELIRTGIGSAILIVSEFVTLEAFTVSGEAMTKGNASGIVIGPEDSTNGAGRATLRDLMVRNFRGNGIWIRNGNTGRMDNVCVWKNAGNGVLMDSVHGTADNVNAWCITHLDTMGNGGDGLKVMKSSSNRLDVVSQGNKGFGVSLNRPYNVLTGYVEGNTAGPLWLGESAFECQVTMRVVDGKATIENGNNWLYLQDGSGRVPNLSAGGAIRAKEFWANDVRLPH